MDWSVHRQQRQILLSHPGGCLEIALDAGGRYRFVASDIKMTAQVVAALEQLPEVGVLVANGGLLGARTVAENFSIALHFGTDASNDVVGEWEEPLHEALLLTGMSPQRITEIGTALPMQLPRTERWLLGFVRCLLRPPELLVFDRIFTGLTRREAEALVKLVTLYHNYHPFRPVLFVDLDTHELPAVSDCRQELRAAEDACLC